ncbi:hypothetical protein EXIGLDRAFT_830896 [Exidia glandulosa HHB12029]|uniref:GH16 domain-containing protein n=1 Tax=Exidia glandulosa HHB12029 TaxID=1314781 RepID=A0A165N5J1_EXIGL|nr:hypothetical protein EXIGLDRAFT_830896 [Exidia glandulosa HHB12029]
MWTGYVVWLTAALAALVLASGVAAADELCDLSRVYLLDDDHRGPGFAQNFVWETFNDPTHGRVNYVDQDQAFAKNLSYFTPHKFIMRVDDENVVSDDARGRDSVRITSRKSYNDSLFILDIVHMPTGCGTWPAWWTVSKKGPWPAGGEVDIIEGVNNGVDNLSSLHTSSGCTMNATRPMTGGATSTNCDAHVNGNQGCGVSYTEPASFGAPFNAAGGGWYAIERNGVCGISVWFWSRDSDDVPIDVQFPSPAVRPDVRWGTPSAVFLPDQCDIDTYFDAHHIVFDDTLCGDWAGEVYNSMGCPGSCVDFVNNNPSSFKEAYWEINSLRTYTPFLFSEPPSPIPAPIPHHQHIMDDVSLMVPV